MFTHKWPVRLGLVLAFLLILVLALALTVGTGPAAAQNAGLGKPLSEADIKQWDIAILPDGTNLPPGSGSPAQGAKIFAEKCSACHGDAAKDQDYARECNRVSRSDSKNQVAHQAS